MRTRRVFRPVVEFMPNLDLPSSLLPGVPTAPVLIPTTPPPSQADPTDPIHITNPQPYDEPYAGPDLPPPIDPAPNANV